MGQTAQGSGTMHNMHGSLSLGQLTHSNPADGNMDMYVGQSGYPTVAENWDYAISWFDWKILFLCSSQPEGARPLPPPPPPRGTFQTSNPVIRSSISI